MYFTFQSGYIQILSTLQVHMFLNPLHSNLVIFKYSKCHQNESHLKIFTFQSGYIQILLYLLDIALWIFLYIPIWLYSNSFSKQDSSLSRALYIPIWLYSNVDKCPSACYITVLYIPIWLYSNLECFVSPLRSLKLYIPIWLYSNP